MKKLKWIYQFKALYGFIVVLLLWYFLHVTVQSNAIPSPFQTILNFIEIFPGELSIHLLVSFLRILVAILISLVAGSLIGLWIGMSKKADELVSPVVYILYPIPKWPFYRYFIMDSWIKVNYVEMFSGILALSIMGFLIFKFIDVVEDRLCGWIRLAVDIEFHLKY